MRSAISLTLSLPASCAGAQSAFTSATLGSRDCRFRNFLPMRFEQRGQDLDDSSVVRDTCEQVACQLKI